MPRTTLEDIAEAAGVSLDTVSRVLSGRLKGTYPKVMERAERIQAIARRLGYQPDANARAMARGTTDAIGVLIPRSTSGVFVPLGLIRGAEKACAAHGKRLVIAQQQLTSGSDVEELPALLRERQVDGLILLQFLDVGDTVRSAVSKAKLPVVWFNDRRADPGIYPDDLGAARQATEQLLANGHRRVAYLHFGGLAHPSSSDREAGYCQAMTQAGLQPQVVRSAWKSILEEPRADDRRLDVVLGMLRAPQAPTAVVCYESHEATTLVVAAALCGKRVPGALAIAAFHQIPIEAGGVAISTWAVPASRMAVLAVGRTLTPFGP